MVYYSEAEAVAALEADGFKRSVERPQFWSKMSKVDDWYGGYASPAIVSIVHHRVDPKWNAPDYFEWKFH